MVGSYEKYSQFLFFLCHLLCLDILFLFYVYASVYLMCAGAHRDQRTVSGVLELELQICGSWELNSSPQVLFSTVIAAFAWVQT